jgi:hypothetical protein
MGGAAASELSEELVAFLGSGVSFLVASRDAELRPFMSKALAVRCGDDRRSLTVYVAKAASASLLAVLAPSSPIAVTAARVATHQTVQIKGVVTGLRDAGDDERSIVETQAAGYTSSLEVVGFAPGVVRRLVTWPAAAIELRIEGLFEQTPGPGAGRSLDRAP